MWTQIHFGLDGPTFNARAQMHQAVFVGLDRGCGRDFITKGAAFDDGCLKRLSFERLRWNCQLRWLTDLMTSLLFFLLGPCLCLRLLHARLITAHGKKDE